MEAVSCPENSNTMSGLLVLEDVIMVDADAPAADAALLFVAVALRIMAGAGGSFFCKFLLAPSLPPTSLSNLPRQR